jgi:hypothetical protein
MLIALAKRDRTATEHHARVIRSNTPLVPGPVLAQVWRNSPTTQFALARYLRDCEIVTAYDVQDYKRVGAMLGMVAPPPKKRPDVVDALVVLTAANMLRAAVLTSDPGDIRAYADALPKADITVVPV